MKPCVDCGILYCATDAEAPWLAVRHFFASDMGDASACNGFQSDVVKNKYMSIIDLLKVNAKAN